MHALATPGRAPTSPHLTRCAWAGKKEPTLPPIRRACLALATAAVLLLQPEAPAAAQGGPPPTAPALPAPPEIATSTTQHVVEAAGGGRLAYTAEAGTITVPEPPGAPRARIFYVAYTLDGAEPGTRPVSFVLNGGPGAASAFLHLGGIGPRRVAFGPDGRVPPPPARLEANPETWLAFTDLVFVDPVGTGYSRALPGEGEGGGSQPFWTTGGDLRSLGGFVRRYVSAHERWRSPKLVVGESYGGFRAAAMAELLPEEFGVELNGVVLVSPALELSLLEGDNYDLLPWALRLPSYAAAARAHGRVPGDGPPLAAVEAFALERLLPGLAQGSRLGGEARDRLHAEYAAFAGLPVEFVARQRGRVSPRRFAKQLLRDRGRVLDSYDAAVDRADPDPAGEGVGDDLERISAFLTAAMEDHASRELKVATDLPYVVLNRDVNRRWDWEGSREGSGAADDLAGALVSAPGLRALVAFGVYDLVTPYLMGGYVLDQMVLDDSARARLEFRRYEGGHMFYNRDEARRAFLADAQAFYAAAAGGDGG